MNAPLTHPSDAVARRVAETNRKSGLWDKLNEFSSVDMQMIDQALSHYAQTRHLEATERQRELQAAKARKDAVRARELNAEVLALRLKASRLTDLQDKITKADAVFFLPEEW